MPETKGDRYKISDGNLKEHPLLPESPPAVLCGHSQVSWHLMAVLSGALPAGDPQPSLGGQLSSARGDAAMPWAAQPQQG